MNEIRVIAYNNSQIQFDISRLTIRREKDPVTSLHGAVNRDQCVVLDHYEPPYCYC